MLIHQPLLLYFFPTDASLVFGACNDECDLSKRPDGFGCVTLVLTWFSLPFAAIPLWKVPVSFC